MSTQPPAQSQQQQQPLQQQQQQPQQPQYYPPLHNNGNTQPQQTPPPPQQPYYAPPPQRPYPSQYYAHPTSIAPSHAQQPTRIARYETRYEPEYDDEFYSDVDYEDGIDDGYYDAEEPDMTKESDKPLSWVWLYVIGLLTCLTVEIITIVLAYFLDIVIVAPLMCSIWFFAAILALCTLSSVTTTPKSTRDLRIRTQLVTTFLAACVVGIVCGLVSSVYLKTAWYYDSGYYYQQVNPSIPSSQYPNAVTASFAQGSYVGKDYTGMIITGGTHYCVAPIIGSNNNNNNIINTNNNKLIPTTFWAIDTDCCMSTNTGVASPGHIMATCQQWGNSVLEGEIRKHPNEGFVSAVFASLSWYQTLGVTSSEDRYYIEILAPGEHDRRQRVRRLTGYLILGIAPLIWPVVMILYAMFTCCGWCCRKKTTPTQTSY